MKEEEGKWHVRSRLETVPVSLDRIGLFCSRLPIAPNDLCGSCGCGG